MRPVHNFLELPGHDDMASLVLKSLPNADLQESIFWSQKLADQPSEEAYEEVQALAALVLKKAGNPQAALKFWDKLIRYAPQNLKWLMSALNDAYEMEKSGIETASYTADWINLLNRIYSKVPQAPFLALLRQKGWQGKGSAGIQNGFLLGWFFLPVGEKINIYVNMPKGAKFNINLKPQALVENNILYTLKESLPTDYGQFSIEFRDVNGNNIPGSPVVCSPRNVRLKKGVKKNESVPVTVLIPVYDDEKGTIQGICAVIASLRKNKAKASILVVWDQGPNQKLLSRLREMAAAGLIILVENSANLGFLGSVNNAIANYAAGDVILLNSDTFVHGNWLDRMLEAGKREYAATVTALSNEAELMSFPSVFNRGKLTSIKQVKILDQAAARLDPQKVLKELPVGVGFCMLITRKAMQELGLLDGTFIFRGYGEESEFCLRAVEHGMKNYGAFNVFVAHLGEQSFGFSKKALAAQNNDVIKSRYPKYSLEYRNFLYDPEIKAINQEISVKAASSIKQPLVLEVWPWGARYFPFLDIRDKRHNENKAYLFLKTGTAQRGCLRIAADLPLAEMIFNGKEQLQELKQLLSGFSINKAICHESSDAIVKLAGQFIDRELEYAEKTAGMPLPADADYKIFYCAPPLTLDGLKSLRKAAHKYPDAYFYVSCLDLLWPNLPKPANIYSLPGAQDITVFSPQAFLLPAGQNDMTAWRNWLNEQNLTQINSYQLELV